MSDKVIYREYWHKYASGKALLIMGFSSFVVFAAASIFTDSIFFSTTIFLIIMLSLFFVFRNRCDLVTIMNSKILVSFLLNKSKKDDVYLFNDLRSIQYCESNHDGMRSRRFVLKYSKNRILTLDYDAILKRFFEEEYPDKLEGKMP
jgi:hypothetical protein